MSEDVSADVAGLISGAKVFGGSDNIRHGKYKMLIKRIFAQMVETDQGKNKMAFWEMTPLTSLPNPQIEGDHVDYPGVAGPLKDDGTHPNMVGSNVALKVNFDGPGARSAGSNIKAAILGLFGKRDGEISDDEINKTWVDLSRMKDLKVGDAVGINPQTNQPIFAQSAKQANPACGMVIYCETVTKRKKTPNDKGAHITKLLWSCVSSPGTGENAPELVSKRRAEIEAARVDDEAEEAAAAAAASAPAAASPYTAHAAAAPQPVAPPPPAAAPVPPAPPAPAAAPFVPSLPWVKHTGAAVGPTPETRWFWSDPTKGGDNSVKSEAMLRSGQ